MVPRRARPSALALVAVTCATLGAPAPAAASGVADSCASASESAQTLRGNGKLVEARARLIECSNPACPSVIKQDCDQWLTAVDASLPTVVVGARDPQGRDLVDTHVFVDDVLAVTQIDGRATPMNPGVHALRFELAGYRTVERTIVVREGEKAREVVVEMAPEGGSGAASGTASAGGPAPSASALLAASSGAAPAPGADTGTSPSPAVVALGALGAVAVGAAVGLYVSAATEASHLRETCAPNCAQADADDVSRKQTWAGVTLGAGLACAAAAVLLYVLGRPAAPAATTSLEVGPASLRVRF